MNIKAVRKHICEELAHGTPIQTILNPEHPKVEVPVDGRKKDGPTKWIPDPDWIKPDLPDWNLVVQWLKEDEAFRADYEHGLTFGAKYLADELVVLKNQMMLETDPRAAGKYKVAMEMIKTSAMWRDAKYSDRTIQEVKNTTPQDPETVMAEIKRLKAELGVGVIEMGPATEVKVKKPRTPNQIAHVEKMRAAKALKDAERKNRG